ncbi:MAG: sulfide/dihydroorotate dehydrogenase-like FAD/NAD-binding protein, partial [Clostridia bacterium]|nr:sulfide/dihydroorotate dehydrogenase-like FAD/NAD-binding protein [Clostridia bacterium]
MFEIKRKESLNDTVTRMDLVAPRIAQKALPGQFVILRVDSLGERFPLTVADCNQEEGTVTVIFQIVGGSTQKLNQKQAGEFIEDLVGPLGRPTNTKGLKKVAVVGGGVGCAIAYPIAKALFREGAQVHTIVGFRNRDLVILEEDFKKVSHKYMLMSDDGSAGQKGLVTDAL